MADAPVRAADVEIVVHRPGSTSRPLIKTDGIKLQEVFFDAGVGSAAHAHTEEQAAYIVSGLFEIDLEGTKYEVGAGDAYSIPGGVMHSVLALETGSYVLVAAFPPAVKETADADGHSHGDHSHGDHSHGH